MTFLTRITAVGPVVALGLLGCGTPVPEAPAPVALAYRMPAVEAALYTVADTATFRVDSGAMGAMTATAAFIGTAYMQALGDGDVVESEIRFLSFHGSFETEPYAAQPVDERDIDGSFMVRIDPRGRYELVDTPTLSQEMLDVASAESLVRPLFVHLPGRPASPGDQWVDTVMAEVRGVESVTRAHSVITTTLVGDTLVSGRPLLLLRTRVANEIQVTGQSGGVPVRQRLTGVTTGTVVWDDRLHMLIERREEGHLTGTLDMEGTAAGGLPLTAEVRRTVVLER